MRAARSVIAMCTVCAACVGALALTGCDKKPPLPPAPMVSAT